jgi:ADP-ribose pyrophosphatase YjhB (NUDIX family)
MITHWAEVVWKKLPYQIRSLIVRATQPKFTASAAVIIVNGKGEVLLLDHRIRPGSGWGLPGGFLEHGEQPDKGIRREIYEETGLDLRDLRLLLVRSVRKHIEILFSAASDGRPQINSNEIKGFNWFAAEHLPEQMNQGQKAFILKVLSGEFEKPSGAD